MSYDDIDAVYDQVEQSANAPSVAPRRMGNEPSRSFSHPIRSTRPRPDIAAGSCVCRDTRLAAGEASRRLCPVRRSYRVKHGIAYFDDELDRFIIQDAHGPLRRGCQDELAAQTRIGDAPAEIGAWF